MLRRVYNAIFANFNMKLLSVAIAIGIWFYADNQLTERQTITVKLDITTPEGFEVLDCSADSVDLTVRGPKSLVGRLVAKQRHMKLSHTVSATDIPQPDGGEVPMKPAADWLNHGLKRWEANRLDFSDIQPSKVLVLASRTISREVPVALAPGLDTGNEIVYEPPVVTVTGPAVAVNAMESVGIEEELYVLDPQRLPLRPLALQSEWEGPVERSGRSQTMKIHIECNPAKVLLKPAASGDVPDTAELPVSHVFRDVPVMFLLPPDSRYRFRLDGDAPRRVSVRVKAPRKDIDRLVEAEALLKENKAAPFLMAYIDLTSPPENMTKGDPFDEQVKVRLPHGISAAEPVVLDPKNPEQTLLKVNIIVDEVLEAAPPEE